jgi:hypothetical protein
MDTENKKPENTVVNPFGEKTKSAYTPSSFLKTLRSYKGDVEEQIKTKHESVASIAIKETSSEKKVKPDILPQPKGPSVFSQLKIGITPLIVILLFLVGGGLLYGAYYLVTRPQPTVVVASTSIIPYTSEKTFTISSAADTRATIMTDISDTLTTPSSQIGSVTYIRFFKDTSELSINDFFFALAPHAPNILVRSFEGAYMSGVYAAVDTEPFIILSTSDFGQTFAGMLDWEPYMTQDLAALFPSAAASGATWGDDTFNNQDVRIIRDASGTIQLVYGFIGKTTLVITGNETAFQQIASKYVNNQLVR